MKPRFAILGSGSQANSYIFQTEAEGMVIDNGFQLREFRKRAHRAGFDTEKIQTVFLTHTHGDHVRGLENLVAATGAVLVHREGLNLASLFRRHKGGSTLAVAPQTSHRLGGIDFYPFVLHHDAPGALSYHFKMAETRFTLITDTGKTDELMLRLAARSDVLFLEANYCPDMLREGPYPPILQERVASDQGHLSNYQTVEFLNSLGRVEGRKTRRVYLVHLSENNNSEDRLRETLDEHCQWTGHLRICSRSELVMGDLGDEA